MYYDDAPLVRTAEDEESITGLFDMVTYGKVNVGKELRNSKMQR